MHMEAVVYIQEECTHEKGKITHHLATTMIHTFQGINSIIQEGTGQKAGTAEVCECTAFLCLRSH